jgi:ABC-type sugar transport system ATPase subunit
MSAARLAIRGLAKSFGPTAALKGVDLELLPGELHVLAGENGAGKSTLIRSLSGVYHDYAGEVRLDGRLVRLQRPSDAARAGIATIHQELSLVGSLSISDNFALYRAAPAFLPLDRRRARAEAQRALAELDLALDPETPVEELALAERQLVEIARALTRNARVLILDEPTSALSAADAERLFERLQAIRGTGTSLLYISHRMDEIFRLADRITVLRDGRAVLARRPADTSADEIIQAMLGRKPEAQAERGARARGKPLLSVRTLSAPPSLKAVAFELHSGEILGLAGLGGSGAREILAALFGASPAGISEIDLAGEPYRPKSPHAAIGAGLALVPGDRGLGVFPDLDGAQNASLSSLRRYARGGFIDERAEQRDVRRQAERFSLRASALAEPASGLSGGNQQKLVLIRCLLTAPRLLLLDDPTRGVDAGAKLDVHRALRELAATGVAVLFYSSELEELGGVCDRVLGLSRGAIAIEMAAGDFDRGRLLSALMGSAA